MRTRANITLGLGMVLASLGCVLALAGPARAAGGVYVALGDSYTSGPLIPFQHGTPIDCGRSDHNYPSLVAQALAPATFIDVSCGSAQTKDMENPQGGLPLGGTNPPQFNALRPDATLVTVGIGGNDAGLVGAGEECGRLGLTAPTGTACRDHFAPGGHDTLTAKIEAARTKVAAVLQGIHQRSPGARVAIVGYPDVLPRDGGSCYPMVPLSPDDVRYFDGVIIRINAMIAGVAATNDAEYVDTYTDSVGHDVCTLPPTRWFEGLTPTELAYPLHPNGKGEASMARSALAVLSRPRPAARPAPLSPPRLTGLAISPRSVRAGSAATIRFRLDRPAGVKMVVRRALAGRRSGRRCVAPTRSNRHARFCTRYARSLLVRRTAAAAGANRLVLSTRALGHRRARYRLTARPTADRVRGRRAARRFTVFAAHR